MKCFCSMFIILLLLCSWTAVVDAQDETLTVEITDLPEGVQGGAFEVTITFSEAVVNFETDDIAFSDDSVGASVTELITPDEGEEDHKKVYTAEITPDADVAGDLTFGVAENVVKSANADVDAEDNNVASESHTVQVDLVRPWVSITNVPGSVQTAAFDITITFSEAVNGFDANDVTISGSATASLKEGSDGDRDYKVTITPAADSEGEVTFQVPAAAATDAALNPNTASAETTSVHIDTRPPTVEITDVPDIEKNVAFDVTITFSEKVNGFAAEDITLTGPAIVSLKSGSDGDSDYEITITPETTSEGEIEFQIPAAVVQDGALNDNTASDSHTVHIDTILPTVETITGIPTIEKNEAFDITITFSEPVNGFGDDGVTVTGPATASLKEGSDGGSVYEVTITPETTSEGDVTFQVSAAAATDAALNPNAASAETDPVHIDTIPPTVETITGIPTIEKNEAFDITITFSEPVKGFGDNGVTVRGPATASLKSGSDGDSVYEITITPETTSEDDVTFQIPAAVVQDGALNDNTASDSHTVHIDTMPPTVEITDVPDIEKNVPFDVTITFSEPVNGFAVADITLTGPATASLKSGSDGDSVYEITITPETTSEDDVTFHVKANAVRDLARNANDAASNRPTVHVDTIPPTVETITGVPAIEKNVPFDVTITFSEPVNGFGASGIAVRGPATASLKSGSDGDSVYGITITPDSDSEGDVTFQVSVAAAKDFALNPNAASAETDPVHIDTIPPTVEVTDVPDIEKNVPFDVTITFSEPVNGFAVADITLTGPATVSLASGSDGDSVYKVTITPKPASEDDVTFKVRAAVVQDSALNDNTTSDSHTVHIDTIPPTVEVTNVPVIEKNVPFDVTITFSEPVNGFAVADITLTGPATVSLASGSDGDSVYKAKITPKATSEDDVTFQVKANAVRDLAGNANVATSNRPTVHVDTIPPTVNSITGVPTIEKNEAFDLTITFSEPVNGFGANDVTVKGPATASLKLGSVGASVYTVTITPKPASEGDVTFQVSAAAATDFALNPNAASAETASVHIDTIPPTVEVTDVPVIEKNVPFDVTITFSEPVNGFTVADITLTGPATASLASGSDGDSVYKAKITPKATSEGEVEFYVKANAVRDLAGNANDATSNRPTVHVDTIPPTVNSITGVPDIEKNVPFDITITFSEQVNGFGANDVTVRGDATASLKSGSAGDSVYKVTITPKPASEGDVTFQIRAAAATDFALNPNAASAETASVHIDTIPPTVKVTDVPVIEKNVPFDVTITFSEPVNGFTVADITLTGPATASLKSGSAGDSVYKVTITPKPTSEGDVTFHVKANAVRDLAGNANDATSNRPTVHVDTIPPTVNSITGVPDIEKNVPFDITITFSEQVNGFSGSDIRLTGPATLSLKEGADGDSVYKVTITPKPDSEDEVEFHVPAAAVKDFALNDNIISTKHAVHVDTIPPEVSITPVPGNTDVFTAVQLETFYLQITFSEEVLEFELKDITFTGDAVVETSELTGGGRTSVLTIRPHVDTDGAVIIKVASGITKDNANNLNKASAERTIYVAPKWIPDPNIRAVVREEMGLIKGADFDQDRLKGLLTLEAGYREIIDVTGLEYATNLTTLRLEGNFVTDLGPFRNLTELTILGLKGNRITDLTPLKDLAGLRSLDLRENIISDIEPLTGLVSLTDLYLTTNQISDISPLADLSNLVVLWVSENPIKNAVPLVGLAETIEADIAVPNLVVDPALRDAIRAVLGIDSSKRITLSALRTLTALQAELKGIRTLTGLKHATALTTLELNGNSIVDITPIQGLTRLTTLNLSTNAIVDITPLAGFRVLTVLNLSNNPLGNLETLTALGELVVLELSGISLNNLDAISGLIGLLELNISNNSIINITPLQKLRTLTALDLSNNPIGSLNVISSFPWLRRLELTGNSITDLTPLASLGRLTTLTLGSNSISVLAPITSLTNLKVLDLNNNNVSDVSALTALTQLETLNLSGNIVSNVEPIAALINLATLRLAENPVLDTTALYPLTQRVPPVNIDISVSRYPPWDVNQDGRVNASDSVLVAAALGQSEDDIVLRRTDVNGDGSVDNADVLLVTENFDEDAAGAPSIADILAGLRPLDREMLEAQLEILIAESDGSLKYLRTIALLQSLLAKLHPDKTRLFANYPNPFNPETWIPYQLADSSDVEIFIYDVRGAVVRHLKLGHQPTGYYIERKHAAHWDGRNAMGENVASGIYFYQLQTDSLSLLRKMLIRK